MSESIGRYMSGSIASAGGECLFLLSFSKRSEDINCCDVIRAYADIKYATCLGAGFGAGFGDGQRSGVQI